MITLALSKGRILEQALPLLERAGIVPLEHPDRSRKLVLATTRGDVQLLVVRATFALLHAILFLPARLLGGGRQG